MCPLSAPLLHSEVTPASAGLSVLTLPTSSARGSPGTRLSELFEQSWDCCAGQGHLTLSAVALRATVLLLCPPMAQQDPAAAISYIHSPQITQVFGALYHQALEML